MSEKLRLRSDDGGTLAEFVPDANMVCTSLCCGGQEILCEREGLEAYRRRGSTMGIPLLYPWANRLDGFEFEAAGKEVLLPHDPTRVKIDPSGLPIHGVIPALLRWRAAERDSESEVRALLRWEQPELLELFPFVHELVLDARVGDGTLTVALTVRACGEDRVPVSAGFHPYLRPPGSAERSTWRIELPALSQLELDERKIPTGKRLAFTLRESELAGSDWDDAFELQDGDRSFSVSAAGWTLAMEILEGFRYAQIYAPRDEQLIAFEPMSAPSNALRSGIGLTVLEPGQEHRASFRVSAYRER